MTIEEIIEEHNRFKNLVLERIQELWKANGKYLGYVSDYSSLDTKFDKVVYKSYSANSDDIDVNEYEIKISDLEMSKEDWKQHLKEVEEKAKLAKIQATKQSEKDFRDRKEKDYLRLRKELGYED